MRRQSHTLLILAVLMLSINLVPLAIAEAQTDERCFAETGFCISGRIREFWEQNGGLPVFGLPIAPQQEESIEGAPFQVQWFERNRLELHPENARPYDVLLGRLGADRLTNQARDWFAFPKSNSQAQCRFFPETGHNICGAILAAWHASGLELDGRRGKSETENLALFGLPLSDAQSEVIEGKEYTIQWFERARFEVHPENPAPYNVLLGLLGNEVHSNPAAASPAPAAATKQFDGYWDGRGPEHSQITLTVVNGRIIFVQLDAKCGSDTSSFSNRTSIPISNSSFEVTNSSFSVNGTFADGAVSGVLEVARPEIGCGGSLNGSWSAHFSGPALLDGLWKGSMGNAADISFFINRGKVSDITFKTPGCGVMSGINLIGEFAIDKNSFYASNSTRKISLSGMLTSNTDASGSIEYQFPNCSYAGPWTATKQ